MSSSSLDDSNKVTTLWKMTFARKTGLCVPLPGDTESDAEAAEKADVADLGGASSSLFLDTSGAASISVAAPSSFATFRRPLIIIIYMMMMIALICVGDSE